MDDHNKTLNIWVAKLGQSELPVLKHTARDLAALREDCKNITAHDIASVTKYDPLMTVKLLRYLQHNKHRSQTTELVQVEQAVLMLGTEPFFSHVAPKPLIEDLLKTHALALPPLLRMLHRAHRAAIYALEWAVYLHDMHYEEVRVAALLHDLAEMLMWCFSPDDMLKIHDIQLHDKALRSRDVQQQVLGFTFAELQRELAKQWGLPELLLILMNDASANSSRVRNVTLAVNLARHSANGWDDAALPDDYTALGELLHIPTEQAMDMVGMGGEPVHQLEIHGVIH
ncbi:MAG: HDOD domain-containing protein [Gallionella sp.]